MREHKYRYYITLHYITVVENKANKYMYFKGSQLLMTMAAIN